MSAPGRHLDEMGFDTFGVAVATALVAGGLSLLAPFLTALTGTLAALAVTSWVVLHGQRNGTWREFLTAARKLGLGILGVGAALFLLPSGPLVPLRGIVLALTLLPLWWVERGRTRSLPRSGNGG